MNGYTSERRHIERYFENKGMIMEDEQTRTQKKQAYVEPKVLASLQKEELEESIRPHGGGGCGCTIEE